MHSLTGLWNKHGDGLDLYDFAQIALDENFNKEKEELNNEIVRERTK